MAPPTQPVNGVLQVPAAILKKNEAKSTNTPRASRKPAEKLKVMIRRLPPGLTATEFETIIGDEWKVGAGKVNWLDYKPGKISKDFSKPSRPARAYLNLTEETHVVALREKLLHSTFTDAKSTAKDTALVGPPYFDFAPYSRVPLGKKRTDARQGTIDQDPEFIDFLQSLTNPVTKPTSLDAEPAPKKEGVTTTPLIEHLREKKAAKEKASKAGKAKQETKESKGDKANKKAAKGQPETVEKPKKLSKAEKAAQQAVKVLNKEAAAVTEKATAGQPAAKGTPERKPERAAKPISVAARIQQDLGLSPAARRAKREASAETQASRAAALAAQEAAATQSPKKAPKAPKNTQTAADKSSSETAGAASKAVPTGPIQPTLLKKPAQAPKGPAAQPNAPKGPKSQNPTQPAPTAPASASSSQPASTAAATPSDPSSLPRHAFLKHANPSQGITEPLIEEALSAFGAIERVEIDRKKGFAYVDFADNEGMKKAIAASPIKVAQGAVQVLEKRDKAASATPATASAGRNANAAPSNMQRGGFRGGRGGRAGRGGARGGGNANAGGASPSPANAAPATAPTAPT